MGTHLSSASHREGGAPSLFGEPRRIQRPQMGRKRSRLELERAMRPQRNPKRSQRRAGLRSAAVEFSDRGFADAAHAQREHEGEGEEHGGEGHLPHPMDGVLQSRGVERPEPGRPYGDLAVVAAGGDFVDGGRDGGGEEAVEGEDDPRGCGRVDAGHLEDGGEQQWIERRDPGGGAGVSDEWVGVAVSGGEGAGDAAHLPAELEVILKEADAVGVADGDYEDAEEKCCPEDKAGGAEGFWRGRDG